MNVRAVLFAASVLSAVVAAVLGGSWSDRLSEHRGYFLVPVRDAVAPAARAAVAPRLPRRTVVVVVDGLGYEEASGMAALSALRANGQCLRTYVGPLSVSQPVYAVISTGLEQDRTGARNNEPPLSRLLAEPIWSVARQAGLTVSGISELSWWERLFPAGPDRPAAFSTYLVHPRPENYFTHAAPADLMLIHPVYVDEAGHDEGAASAHYKQAVRRADSELAAFVATLDLSRDLLVVTADHGHSLRGGHGGQQERITHVLTCYAGPGVRRSAAPDEMRTTSIAPSLALLMGLRFPAHMRAGLRGDQPDDDLDVLWRIADPAALPPAYLADRRQAVTRFREENRDQLARWPGAATSWTEFFAQHRQTQRRGVALVLVLALGVLGLLSRFPRRPGQTTRDALFCVSWVAAVYLVTYLLMVGLRGSFDPTAINKRLPFIYFGMELSAGVLLCAGALHVRLRRSIAALRADVLALLAVTVVLSVGHPAVLGWHLGFPVPHPVFIFFPYFASLFLLALAGLALPLCLTWAGDRRAAPPREPR